MRSFQPSRTAAPNTSDWEYLSSNEIDSAQGARVFHESTRALSYQQDGVAVQEDSKCAVYFEHWRNQCFALFWPPL